MTRTTLITGAGKRIGAGIAQHLAARGHNLVLHYGRSHDEAQALAQTLRAAYGTVVTLVQADLEDTEALADFWAELPPVTAVVHNAAVFAREGFAAMTASSLRQHLTVNLEAPLLLTQGFLAQLPQAAAGSVVVLGDGSHGFSMSPEFFGYAVSKLAWQPVIELLAVACAPRVRANMIALGPTLPGEIDDDAMHARIAARSPLRRRGHVGELYTAIDFLLASDGVTGQTISLANGFGLRNYRPLADA